MSEQWRKQAICYGQGAGFTDDGTEADKESAKTICKSCPVRVDCARYAMEVRPEVGIWAGVEVTEVGTKARRSRAFRQIANVLTAAGESVPEGRHQQPIDHGTARGYKAHFRRGIPPCLPCREAADRNRNALRDRRTGREQVNA